MRVLALCGLLAIANAACPYVVPDGAIVIDIRGEDEYTGQNGLGAEGTDGEYAIVGSYKQPWTYDASWDEAAIDEQGATFIAEFETQFPWANAFTPIYTYCKTGGRAGQLRDALNRVGNYVNVINLGGWEGTTPEEREDQDVSYLTVALKDIPTEDGGPSCGVAGLTLNTEITNDATATSIAENGFTLKNDGNLNYIPLAFECPYDAFEGIVLDIRGDDEIAEGAVSCAASEPKWTYNADGTAAAQADNPTFVADFEAANPDATLDTPIYVYCRTGGRAGQAARTLEEAGYTAVFNLGGYPSNSPGFRESSGEDDNAIIGAALVDLAFTDCGCPAYDSPINPAAQDIIEAQRGATGTEPRSFASLYSPDLVAAQLALIAAETGDASILDRDDLETPDDSPAALAAVSGIALAGLLL